MHALLTSFFRDEAGATAIEYGLIVFPHSALMGG